MLRSDVLQSIIQNHPQDFLEGFKQTVELRKSQELGPHARLKEDYLGRIGPTTEDVDIGVNAVSCISLYTTICGRLQELERLRDTNGTLSPLAMRNLIRAIEAICSRLNMGLEDLVGWNRVPFPWDRIKPRSKVMIATCERPHERLESHQIPGGATAFSAHDTYVYVHLHAFFAGLPTKPTVHHVTVPYALTVKESSRKLDDLLSDSPAAIVTVGSAHGNPLTGSCFDHVFDDIGDRRLPAGFVWNTSPKQFSPVIERHTDHQFPEPGIWLESGQFLNRNCDPNGLPDAGIFVIDARQDTVLCCLAGHGGIGTLAAASAMLETSRVADALQSSTSSFRNRIFQVLEIANRETVERRSKKSRRSLSCDSDEWIPADLFWQMKQPAWWRYALG